MRPATSLRASSDEVELQEDFRAARSGGLDQPKLRQSGHAVIEADLLHDLPVEQLQHSGSREMHLAASRSRKTADQKVVESRTGMGPATFPLTDDIVALGDQISRSPEIEIGECCTEIGHKRLDVGTAPSRLVQRISEQHVRGGDLVDDRKIDVLAPEFAEPSDNNRLVGIFFAHQSNSS